MQQFTVFYAYAANYGFTCEAAEQGWGIEGSKGKRKRSREAQGTLESPRLGQEDAQGVGGGLRAKLGSPQTWPEKGSHTISLPEQEEKVRGGGKPQNRALSCSSNRKEKLVVQGSC